MTLELAIPEVATRTGELTYRITIQRPDAKVDVAGRLVPVHINGQVLVSPIYRTLAQLCWLQHHLRLYFEQPDQPHAVLPLFDDHVESNQFDNPTYVKRQQFHAHRYLVRLASRSILVTSPPMLHFLSENMSANDVIQPTSQRMARFSLFRRSKHRPRTLSNGFRIIAPTDPLEGVDQATHATRQRWILDIQRVYREAAERLGLVANLERDQGRQLAKVGDRCLQTLHSRYRLGSATNSELLVSHKQFDRQITTLAVCLDDLRDQCVHQSRIKLHQVADVMSEHTMIWEALKQLMDERTEHLLQYTMALTVCDRVLTTWERTQQNTITAGQDSKALQEEAKAATAKLTLAKKRYYTSQSGLDVELEQYNSSRTHEMRHCLHHFAQTQLAAEKAKLQSLLSAVHAIRMEPLPPVSRTDSRTPTLTSVYSSGGLDTPHSTYSPLFHGHDSGSTLNEDLARSSLLNWTLRKGSLVPSAPTSRPFSPVYAKPRSNSITLCSDRLPTTDDPLTML
ncbi:hypothetical protein IWQ62_004244 [Dispira parvispora]|uniref:Sorting nexin/Vps5-like C-terminal domain-containing protein n=1 Tax=Dispira parvispora TaxID=1520584 RepID=A0A9W8E6B6_9FUNG|nr:hypothetical protein IWQ62_004244 [Dispira parvispora]